MIGDSNSIHKHGELGVASKHSFLGDC